MELEIQNTKSDYKQFLSKNYFTSNAGRIILLVAFISICIYNFSLLPSHTINWSKFLIPESIVLPILFSASYFLILISLNKSIVNNPSLLEKKQITLGEDGISINAVSQNATLRWESVNSIYKTKLHIVLLLADKKFGLIPLRFFASENETAAFYNYIENKVQNIKSKSNLNLSSSDTSKTAKHLYRRGWLGLIPLIGAVVGIGLICLGIFKYRDRKLTLIGVSAVLFTVIFYTVLFYHGNNSNGLIKP